MAETIEGALNTAASSIDIQSTIPNQTVQGVVNQIQALLDMGGPVVLILALMSILVLTVVFYKFWQFAYVGIGRHRAAHRSHQMWKLGNRSGALGIIENRRSPACLVLAHAMRGQMFHADKGDLIREDLERVATHALSEARSFLRLLELVGQIAPLLGLFGTVIGMIQAFQKLQQAGAVVDPSVLAGGIWVALLTTAVGLAVAIPASLFAEWFTARLEREQQVMEELVTSILTGLITEQAPSPKQTPAVAAELSYAT